MPAKPRLDGKPAVAASADPRADGQDLDLISAGRQPVADAGTLDSDGFASPAERRAAERTERRRQRTVAHDAPTAAREPRRPGRRDHATGSTRARKPLGRMTVRDSGSRTLIAVLVAGGVVGAILGALSVAGWVVGLLVAGLTLLLVTVLRPHSRPT